MANPNIFKKAGVTLEGNYTITGDLNVNGNINKGNQQALVNASSAAGLLNSLAGTFSQPGRIWNAVTNSLGNGACYFSCFGNATFVVGGNGGVIGRSIDNGLTYSAPSNPFGVSNVLCGDFGNGVFVLGAAGGKIARSTDNGATWGSLIVNNFVGDVQAMKYFKGIFMAGDSLGNISYSLDFGVTWSALIATGGASTFALSAGTVNAIDIWLAGGAGAGSTAFIAKSINNGATWATVYTHASVSSISTLAFLNAVFSAGGTNPTLLRSPDGGVTWSVPTTNPFASGSTVKSISTDGNQLVAVNGGACQISYSNDTGQNWTLAVSLISVAGNVTLNGLSFGNSTFVLVGEDTANKILTAWSSWLSYGKSYLYYPLFQGFGAPTGVNFFWQRKPGSNTITVFGKFTAGTTTQVEARIGIPVGLLSDSVLIPSIMACGIFVTNSALIGSEYCLIESGVGYVTCGNQSATASGLNKVTGAEPSDLGVGTISSIRASRERVETRGPHDER